MRNQLLSTISAALDIDSSIIVLLGDLGTFQMSEASHSHPLRVINFGIMEQSMVGFAAGLANAGLFPVLYSITPFLVDRSLEQIKIDLIYNNNNALILSAGGSYDYSTLGPTHHCPHDISNLRNIGFPLILHPFTISESSQICNAIVKSKMLSYFRLTNSPVDITQFISNSVACNSFYLNHCILGFQVFTMPDKATLINGSRRLLVLFGPDSILLSGVPDLITLADAICTVSAICSESLRKLTDIFSEYNNITLAFPYDSSAIVDEILSNLEGDFSFALSVIGIKKGVYYDNSYSKDALFRLASTFNPIVK